MPLNIQRARQLLRAFQLDRLFIEEMGWDQPGPNVDVELDGVRHTLVAVAQKRGMAALVWQAAAGQGLPDHQTRRRIEREARKRVHEHLIIFTDHECSVHKWQWVRRARGKPAASREWDYVRGQTEEPLLARLQGAVFEFEEEEGLTIGEVAGRVRSTFDVERVTKRFCDQFKREHDAFLGFLKGIPDDEDARWYVSVTLNRLMFIYFIQQKQFLHGDPRYLRSQLAASHERGRDRFYRDFLCPLFFEGFARQESERSPEVNSLLGQVPYLNGGIFARHELEERYGQQIQIPDRAFERLFDSFEQYRWQLDERPLRADNEINPDVLGYIFEKYINQKQMGAYYTKEDITGYISKYTVLPYLLDQVRKHCHSAFEGESSVWRLLAADPERYIYPAVGHGVAWNARTVPPERLPAAHELPASIAAGAHDVAQRGGWNVPAPEAYALPTEIWREVVARRERYEEVRGMLARGEVREVDDLITLNLDIQQLAQDIIEASEGPELVRAFWKALREIKVLDPTCGSGAFLFAALNILEPLYEACLERMRELVDELERSGAKHRPEKLSDLRQALDEMARHPNQRYYILKSIIVHNLYGVDIMAEAVEICRLRLFLRLVAQVEKGQPVEPLPDIDFNVRAGNTLVGFASLEQVRAALLMGPDGQPMLMPEEENLAQVRRIEEDAEAAHHAYLRFQEQQTEKGWVTPADKAALRDGLQALNAELNRALARTYHVDPDAAGYEPWLASHRPFHWWSDFYGIMASGGFDVVIGNPPWREYSAVRKEYSVCGYSTERCGNLHGMCTERATALQRAHGRLSFIVQLPLANSSRMSSVREVLREQSELLAVATFDDRPGKLFEGLQHCRAVVFLAKHGVSGSGRRGELAVSRYQRWPSEARAHLFQQVAFTRVEDQPLYCGCFPKYAASLMAPIFARVARVGSRRIGSFRSRRRTRHFVFYQEATQYWVKATAGLPYYAKNGVVSAPARGRYLYCDEAAVAHAVCAVLNSSLFYLYFVAYGDCFHLSDDMVAGFPITSDLARSGELAALNGRLMKDLAAHAERQTMNTADGDIITYDAFNCSSSKPIIDEIDRLLGQRYGFSEEELDFIINYDIKYRMGLEGLGQDSAEEEDEA